MQWTDVDFFGKTLEIRRQSKKTDAGVRVLSLNQATYDVFLKVRAGAEGLANVEPAHHVFPACENGNIQPQIPMKGWRSAWRTLTTRASLKGLRFHDLRYHAITELAEMGFE